jgi:pantothenate kinase-related protein Tda10
MSKVGLDIDVLIAEIRARMSKFADTEVGKRDWALRQLKVVLKLKATYTLAMKTPSLREAPFVVLLHGGTSVGKSTLTKQLIAVLRKTVGEDADERFTCYLNTSSKFSDEYLSYHEVIVFDDIANKKASTPGDCPDIELIIKVCNNAPCAVVKAAVKTKDRSTSRPN